MKLGLLGIKRIALQTALSRSMPVSCYRVTSCRSASSDMAVIGPGKLKSLPKLVLGVAGQMIMDLLRSENAKV